MKKDIIKEIIKFRNDRDWEQFHNPKDLAISINLEAAELLENFQWTGEDTKAPDKKNEIAEELADVLIYCVLMAEAMDMDINEIIKRKLEINKQKYPIAKAYGSKKKYKEL